MLKLFEEETVAVAPPVFAPPEPPTEPLEACPVVQGRAPLAFVAQAHRAGLLAEPLRASEVESPRAQDSYPTWWLQVFA